MKFAKKALSALAAPLLFVTLFLLPNESNALFSSKPYVPASIVSLSSGYVIVVEKQTQKLYVFKKNGNIVKVFEAPCSTGKKPGAKQEPGDAKTPDGIFFIYKYYNSSELTSIYGPMAFHLDFPNVIDRRLGRNGTNIWIHGINKPLQPNQSNGCVALRNSDIEHLARYIFLNKTPVIIEDSIKWVSQDKDNPEKNELERIIALWDRATNEGDIKTLASLYTLDSREKIDQKSITQKSSHLKSIEHHLPIQPRDISILKQDNFAVVLFDKITSVKSDMSFQGSYVRLFLQKSKEGWFIVEDTNKNGASHLARNVRTIVKEQPPAISQAAPTKVTTAAVSAQTQQARPVTPPVASAPQAPPQQTAPQRGTTVTVSAQTRPVPIGTQNTPPAPPAQLRQKANQSGEAAITRLVNHWADSWESGNMKEYRSCFAPDFKTKGMNLNRYIDYKGDLARKYKKISVQVSDIKISYSGDQHATVTFNQKYSASRGPKTSGRKKLELKKIRDAWKIQREVMSR